MMRIVEVIRRIYDLLSPAMDERLTRLFVAAVAVALGPGGTQRVVEATGIRSKRIWHGKRDLKELGKNRPGRVPGTTRVRRPGAGRKALVQKEPTLLSDLESLVDPLTRGDPESSLRWTCKSTRTLAAALRAKGHQVSFRTVAALLRDHLQYNLQANQKVREGKQHPDRNAQFEHINSKVEQFQAAGQPVISVDTKKKELVGSYKNGGREWQPEGEPERVNTYDFPDPEVGKAIPYGVYDVDQNTGFVAVGVDHDTAAFAVDTIHQWWRTMGSKAYPDAQCLLITADGGGSNGSRNRLWKVELKRFADETGLTISVCHFPPGTSKWNKIEHRMFSEISINWRGRPLETHQTVVNLIGSTRTQTGLRIRAKLNRKGYPTGIKIPDATMKELALRRDDFHGEWNYTIVAKKQNRFRK